MEINPRMLEWVLKRKKMKTLNKIFCTAGLAMVLANSAFADGLKVITTCKNLSATADTQVNLTVTRSVDYNTKKGTIQVDYSGKLNYDASPYSLNGSFSADLPVTNVAVPNLLPEYSASADSKSLAVTNVQDKSTTPLSESRLVLKIPLSTSWISGQQFVVLKIATNLNQNGAAIGAVYLTDLAESKAHTPDGGAGISLICQSEAHDL